MSKALSRFTDEELLKQRFCDLQLSLKGTAVQNCVERLYDELNRRKILIKPPVWLSTEWFSPDGAPGIAIPFYLAHPRLKRLERSMMFQVEGGATKECMKILRHEAGHAVSNAYRLHFKSSWRQVFGKYSKEYPTSYLPQPISKDFVHHLDWWYAQAHPAEDFAETFAVWLSQTKTKWKKTYRGWGALQKLEYVDSLMKNIAGEKPKVKKIYRDSELSGLKKTLKRHYQQRRQFYIQDLPDIYDRDLVKLFTMAEKTKKMTAAQFLRKYRKEIREAVSLWTGQYEYTIDHVLKAMIERCQDLQLKLQDPISQTKQNTMLMVAVQTMNFMYKTPHWIHL